MTLVQNLRRRLSGNESYLVFIVLFFFCILSCTGSKKSVSLKPENAKSKVAIPEKKDTIDNKIPIKEKIDTAAIIFPKEIKNNYRIAYLLPFKLNSLDDEEDKQPGGISRAAVEFYMGSLVALENTTGMLNSNTTYNARFFDTEKSDPYLKNITLKALDKFNPDLIIGPFFPSEIKIVSAYSLIKRTTTVCPLANVPECLKVNPYLIAEKPPQFKYIQSFVQYFKRNYTDGKIILFGSTKKENDTNLYLFNKVDSILSKTVSTVVVNESNWGNTSYLNPLKSEKTFFYIPITNEFVVNSILSNLMKSDKNENLVIFAPYKWLEFNSIDISYLLSLNIIFTTDHYINYKDEINKEFIKAYREKFNTEPTKYSFLGYEITLFYGNALSFYGKYFQDGFLIKTIPDIYFGFNPGYSFGPIKGFERVTIKYLRFDEYELKEYKTE